MSSHVRSGRSIVRSTVAFLIVTGLDRISRSSTVVDIATASRTSRVFLAEGSDFAIHSAGYESKSTAPLLGSKWSPRWRSVSTLASRARASAFVANDEPAEVCLPRCQ